MKGIQRVLLCCFPSRDAICATIDGPGSLIIIYHVLAAILIRPLDFCQLCTRMRTAQFYDLKHQQQTGK